MDRKLRSRGINDKKPKSARGRDSKPGNSAKKKLKPRISTKKHQKSVSNGNNNSKPETVPNEDPKSGSSKNKDPKPETIRNSEPKPGPSRDVDRSDQPKKKCKVEDVEVRNGRVCMLSCKNINDLPNEMLLEIFRYLSVPERLKAENVCVRWDQLLRSEVFWKYVNLSNVSNSFFVELLESLPDCVSELRINGCCEIELKTLPISLPELLAKLHEKCPSLESLHLENLDFVKNLHCLPSHCSRRSAIYNAHLIDEAKKHMTQHSVEIIETQFPKEENINVRHAVLPKLQVLSFRRVLFSKHHISSYMSYHVLPKIVVLDLDFSKPLGLNDINLFPSLVNLEELYLNRWNISDNCIKKFIQNSKRLKVLNLENSRVTDKTVSLLKRHCIFLEELYLGFTKVGDIYRDEKDKYFFPNLKSLCLKHTQVTPIGIERLVADCPSLEYVNIGNNAFEACSKYWLHRQSYRFKKKVVLKNNIYGLYCNHIKKRFYKSEN